MRFFCPTHARTQHGKPGAYVFEDDLAGADTEQLAHSLTHSYARAASLYKSLLDSGVAKEQARLVLPVAVMTQFYWTVNARSLMNFLSLRFSPHAMKEIRAELRASNRLGQVTVGSH